jgi:hypothetical protein
MGLVAAGHLGAEAVRLQVDTETVLSRVSEDFIGFGYESSAVAQPNFFSAENAVMVRLYRNLSHRGLIRIGGNVSDHTQFVPDGVSAARTEREVTVINRTNLVDLGDFARATGWKVMWGLNLGTGSKDEAAREAQAVDAALGTNLQSFEIGNEVDALRRFSNSYSAYHTAFVDYKGAIRLALPRGVFSGPDVIGNWVWITNFAGSEAGDMTLLTQHYYRGGAGNAGSTLEKLLRPDEAWDGRLEKLRQLCRDNRLAFRINEVNSFSGGGKPGVSDTFGSALWALDFMFRLAAHGCDGINLETDVNQLGFISHYSPIGRDAAGRCVARPEYYGMLAFALSGKGELLKVTRDKTTINLSAYASRDERGNLWLTVINKDFSQDAEIAAALPEGFTKAEAYWLKGASMESKDQVTFAGVEVSTDGSWTPGLPESVAIKESAARLLAPHASAVLLRLWR